jgi:glycerol-3-phosphate O-acyltransferase
METVCFSETVASTDESTQHQNPEEIDHKLLKHMFTHFSDNNAKYSSG